MPTERKIALVAELKELLERSEVAIATGYQGMAVEEQTALRGLLRESGVALRIVKNTLLLRAATRRAARSSRSSQTARRRW